MPGRVSRAQRTVVLPHWSRSLVALAAGVLFPSLSYGLDDGTWSALNLAEPAGATYSGSLAYDSLRHRVLALSTQLKALDLDDPTAWTVVTTTGSVPGATNYALLVYDSLHDRLVRHGGSSGGSAINDTWFFNFDDASGSSGAWQTVLTDAPPGVGFPAARYGHSGIYDPVRDELIFYGGFSGGCQYSISVWALTMSGQPTWRNPSTAGFGGGVHASAWGYDAVDRKMVVYGGFYHGACGHPFYIDYWANTMAGFQLDGTTWSTTWPNATGPIAYESGAAGAWDSERRRIVAMRHITTGTDGLTVGWSPATADWDTLAPAGTGPNNAVAMLYDPLGDRMLVYGNSPAANWWFLSFAPTSDVPLEPAPPVGPLLTARPNPMSGRAVLAFELPKQGVARLSVIDARGRLIARLLDEERPAGRHETSWDGRAADGSRVASGIYFMRLEAAGSTSSTRLVVAD